MALKAIGGDARAALVETRAIRATIAMDLSNTQDVAVVAETLVNSDIDLIEAMPEMGAASRERNGVHIRPPPPLPSLNPGVPAIPDAQWAPRLSVSFCISHADPCSTVTGMGTGLRTGRWRDVEILTVRVSF